MTTTPNPGPVQPWWKQAALWIGAVPLLLFLVLAAVDLSLAQQFTSTATRQRATVNFKGLRLPQAPMRAHYSWDSLWRYTQGVRKFAGALKWKAARLEGVMRVCYKQ